MITAMADTLRAKLSVGDALVLPLAVGRHVDHLVVREAAEQSGHAPLLYYPDMPYLHIYPREVEHRSGGLCALRYAVSADQTALWIAAAQSYITQIPMLEKAAGPLPELIRTHAAGSGLQLYGNAAAADFTKFGPFAGMPTAPIRDGRPL